MAGSASSTEWTMPDGSAFTTAAVFDDGTDGAFLYTSVTAIVAGKAYAGRLHMWPEDVEIDDLCMPLLVIPDENIWPMCPKTYARAPKYDPRTHYMKSPSFTYEDTGPGKTFVAERVACEAEKYEFIKQHPHPSIAQYLGCVVEDGRIKQICLRRYPYSLATALRQNLGCIKTDAGWDRILFQIISALRHLHSLRLVHNDITAENIYVDESGNAFLTDFDSCEWQGSVLNKGYSLLSDTAMYENDWLGIASIEDARRMYLDRIRADVTT